MAKHVLISEMQKFHFGNKVFCSDGQSGTLAQVFFDSSRRLTTLAVKQGRLFGKTSFVPFAAVSRATGDGIWLKISQAELEASQSAPASDLVLDGRSSVQAGGQNGTLLLVAVQPESGELAYIVAHNVPAGQDTLLRATYLSNLTSGQVSVSATAEALTALPPYRPDSELQKEVDEIVFDLPFLHIDLKGMRLRVLDSVLYLEGNISSALRGDLVGDQVSGVKGLLEIKNNLIGDDTLAADIALALGQDERTSHLPIGVYPQLGQVRLSGSVRTAQQKNAATEIASSFDGVRSVSNDLVVDPSAEMLYVMSAPEGGEARDITPGKFTRHTH